MHDEIQGRTGKAGITMARFMEQKGAMYAESFHPDPEKYEAAQAFAYGAPAYGASQPQAVEA